MNALLRVVTAFAFVAAIATGTQALADTLPTPEGEPLLTVSGAIEHTNVGDTAVFDREMLEALPETVVTTKTIWTEGEQTLRGVSLKALMEAVGAEGQSIRATAINDYAVDIPMSDARDGAAVVAYELNGAPMPVRSKGPLWIVYPYDSNADFRSEVVYSRSIWQLRSLTVSR